ncbi:DNA-binding protein [Bacteroidales bacterium OttesenSCG-928-A17]|nr:DNA-binding protein [Bacteroidales bacterium OttesenSCG-928-A17]
MKTITFNELRRIKDSLPDGSMRQIAAELGLSVEDVKNYFGGLNHSAGTKSGIHIEPGPDGGVVILDDSTILDKALIMLGENNHKVTMVNNNV